MFTSGFAFVLVWSVAGMCDCLLHFIKINYFYFFPMFQDVFEEGIIRDVVALLPI